MNYPYLSYQVLCHHGKHEWLSGYGGPPRQPGVIEKAVQGSVPGMPLPDNTGCKKRCMIINPKWGDHLVPVFEVLEIFFHFVQCLLNFSHFLF